MIVRRGPARIVLVTAQTTGGIGRHVSSLLAELRICVSEDVARAARAAAPAKAGSVIVMPVGADPTPVRPEEAAAAREQLGLEAGRPLVVGVGRLDPQKGFDVLVEATARMNGSSPPIVVICGEGPARAELEDRIRALGLGGQVRLLGNRQDAKALIAA